MSTQVGKPGGPMLTRGDVESLAPEKPKGRQELGLCLAPIALLAWALFVGLHGWRIYKGCFPRSWLPKFSRAKS